MNSTTTILIALTLALLLVAAFYGLSDSVLDTGGEAIDNFSETESDDDDNIQFSSAEPHFKQRTEDIDIRSVVV